MFNVVSLSLPRIEDKGRSLRMRRWIVGEKIIKMELKNAYGIGVGIGERCQHRRSIFIFLELFKQLVHFTC